jgi:hypothetical protein
MRDYRGTVPKVGDYVAYNKSGQIALGHILYVSKDKRNFRILEDTDVKDLLQFGPQPTIREKHISRIKGGARCLLVLESAPDEPVVE